MYFQIRVTEKHRNLLRLLWWKDYDFSKVPIDHEMCAHLFGGVSSGPCSNYPLKRTAKENVKKHGTETACTLRDNFYVYDL